MGVAYARGTGVPHRHSKDLLRSSINSRVALTHDLAGSRKLQDLAPPKLLAVTAIVSLAILVTVYILPRLAKLILPRRWIRAVSDVASSPASFASHATSAPTSNPPSTVDRKLFTLITLGALEGTAWLVGAIYTAVRAAKAHDRTQLGSLAVVGLAGISLGWYLSSLLLLEKRKHARPSAPLLNFNFYCLHVVFLSFHVISLAIHHTNQVDLELALTILHALAVLSVLVVTLRMPLSSHSIRESYTPVSNEDLASTNTEGDSVEVIDSKDKVHLPSPEPHVTLFEWVVFSWIGPLIAKGKSKKLGYSDVWQLPFEMSSVGIRATSPGKRFKRLIPQIFFNNSQDLILSLTLGLVSSFLSYCSPYFLKQILQSLSPPTPGEPFDPNLRKSAYIYGLLAFVAQIARAEVDLQQLWHERRAIIRTRSQLMADVYEKALKRRDPSGATGEDADKLDKSQDKKKQPQQEEGKKEGNKKKPQEGRGSSSTGKIVSLMSGDANKVAMQLMSLSSIVAAPFELAIAIAFLYQLLGWTCLAGLSVLAISLPVNNLLVTRRIKIHRSMLSARDSRMEVINELFNAIRFVKYSADERNWLRRVGDKRETELKWLLRTRLNSMFLNVVWNFTPDLVMLISFACFTLILGKPLTVPIAFTSLALFALVRGPMSVLPMSITQLLQTYVSIQRLEQFFDEPEVDPWVSALREEDATSTRSEGFSDIGIVNGTFKYSEETTTKLVSKDRSSKNQQVESETEPQVAVDEPEPEPEFELKEINVSFPSKALSLVAGPTGSGKSSLFLALLGEMTRVSGEIHLRKGTPGQNLDSETGLYEGVAYAAQLPWLQHASIRNNILFGSAYEKERYDATIDACALRPDLDMFDAGDETEIGERGISLSGGQKARVALARAVYSRAKTVFLDDPLSAVDSHTARHLYRKCLKGPLLENRTVVLVTHHISLCLPGAEYFVSLSEGRIEKQGRVADMDQSELQVELTEEDEVAEKVEEAIKLDIKDRIDPADPKGAEHAAAQVIAGSDDEPPRPSAAAAKKTSEAKGKLVEEEARQTGRVKFAVYSLYLRSAGYTTWALIFLLILAGRVFRVADRWWFRVWGESYHLSDSFFFRLFLPQNSQLSLHSFDAQPLDTFNVPNFPSASESVSFYLVGYGIICLANLALLVFGILVAFNGSFKASRALFTDSLTRVVHAPFRHFDATPVGRILSRYSQDMSTIDGSLMDQIRICMTHALSFVVQMSVIVVVSPYFIPPAILIIAAYVYYSLMYVKTSRDLRRLESVARSPIFSKFGETLQGIVTCRAFGSERRFLGELFESVDKMLSCAYANALSNRYLLFRFDSLGALAVIITTYLALISGASPGLAALAITSAQALVQSVYWLCRFWSQLEVDLNAVERVTDLLSTPQEPPQIIEGMRPPATWPSSVGGISIENLSVRYAPNLPDVIKQLSVDFAPRSKIGLVGRTGSGKSSLATSLLRFVEPSSGKIIIDGIDVCKIGLYDLRSAVTLIPQEAVLFAGTIRSNLDPFNQHTDADCLDVLERVGLSSSSSTLATPSAGPSRAESPAPGSTPPESNDVKANASNGRLSVHLGTAVSAGGHNFSAGQRQLLALARALLRRSSVIIMDESTASVDFETDEKIQQTIREGFSDSLVITIAHRLRSIIDYDKILVLDKGELAEFDSPAELLKNRDGIFRGMCEKAADWTDLKKMAGLDE
ncbi:uncharacterized protein JCM15063_002109 [Sporobolomyces koalae]|uniref:uncharacterized protein n=1 Tax=Sporobolomyces koalae TaxID=500713 RepID=UPI00317BA37E